MVGRLRILLPRVILLQAFEDLARGRKAAFDNIPLTIHGVLVFAQIVNVFQKIAAIHLSQYRVLLLLILRQQILGVLHFLLLESLVLRLLGRLDELRYARDDLVEVAGDSPLFAVHYFGVEIAPIIQINVVGESRQAKYLRRREGIFVVKEHFPYEMPLEFFKFWLICALAKL